MKKAALRRVIIYVLVFSLAFTSVSAAIVRPVEVQAIVGADDVAIAILLGLLSTLGYYAASKDVGKNVMDELYYYYQTNYEKASSSASNYTSKTYIKNSEYYNALVSCGLSEEDAYKAAYDMGLISAIVEFNYSYSGVSTWTIEKKNTSYYIKDYVGNYVIYTTIPMLSTGFLSKDAGSYEIEIYDNSEEVAKLEASFNFIHDLLLHLKGFISVQLNTALNKGIASISRKHVPYSLNAKKSTFKLGLADLIKSSRSYARTDLLSALSSKTNDELLSLCGGDFPSQYLILSQESSVGLYILVSEDLTGYSIIFDNSTKKIMKVDSSGATSDIQVLFNCAIPDYRYTNNRISFNSGNEYTDGSSVRSLSFSVPYWDSSSESSTWLQKSFSSPGFAHYSGEYYRYRVVDIPNSRLYSSLSNYYDNKNFEVENSNYSLIGDDSYADANERVYIPDLSKYLELVKQYSIDSVTSDELKAQLAELQAAYYKQLEDMKDSIEEGNATTASLLQKILDAVLALPTSIISNVSVDVSAIKSLISSLDTSISDSLSIIQDVADNGALTVEKVNELVDAINNALEKNGVIGGVNERVDGIAEDVDVLTKAISGVVEGTDSISVSVDRPVYRNNQEEPEDNFNNGFFGILFFLFSLFFKILQLLFDCLMFLFTLHNVKASPYFLNDDMVQGLSWMKKIGIKGDLLNVSLYQFLFVLVRIVIVFSVVKLIRKWVNKL